MDIKENEAHQFEVEIDGHKYEFSKWGAIKSSRIIIRINKVAKGFMAKAVAAKAVKATTQMELQGVVEGVVTSLLSGISDDENLTLELLQILCAEKVACDNKVITSFDEHYRGRPMHIINVCKAALEVQYGTFFDDMVSLGKDMA